MKEVFINGSFIVEDKKVNKLINEIKRIVKKIISMILLE